MTDTDRIAAILELLSAAYDANHERGATMMLDMINGLLRNGIDRTFLDEWEKWLRNTLGE